METRYNTMVQQRERMDSMSYVALYRTWRPQDFDGLVGQEHIRKALTNALESGAFPMLTCLQALAVRVRRVRRGSLLRP